MKTNIPQKLIVYLPINICCLINLKSQKYKKFHYEKLFLLKKNHFCPCTITKSPPPPGQSLHIPQVENHCNNQQKNYRCEKCCSGYSNKMKLQKSSMYLGDTYFVTLNCNILVFIVSSDFCINVYIFSSRVDFKCAIVLSLL